MDCNTSKFILLFVFSFFSLTQHAQSGNKETPDTSAFLYTYQDTVKKDGVSLQTDSSSQDVLQDPVPDSVLIRTAEIFDAILNSLVGAFGPAHLLHNNAEEKILAEISELYIPPDSSITGALILYPFQHLQMISLDPNQNYLLAKGPIVDFSQTHTLLPNYKVEVRLDTSGEYYSFSDYFGSSAHKHSLKQTVIISRKEYLKYNLDNQIRNTFSKSVVAALSAKEAERTGPLRLFSASVTTNETFQKIFGGDEVAVDARGNINLSMSVAREATSNQNAATGKSSQIIPKFEQKQQFNLRATIGQKVEILIDQDSEREFEFENNIRIIYTGFDDEVLQKLEAGNIDLSLPGTEFVTAGGQNKGLFGVKALMRFGDLNVTTIASLQRGEKTKLSFKGGAGQGNEVKIKEYQYARAKYFFLDTVYRNQFEQYQNRIHVYNPNDEILNWKVFKYSAATQSDPRARPGKASFNDTSEVFIRNFIELENGVDYMINPKLGIVALSGGLTSLDEILAVWYQTGSRVYGDVRAGLDTLKLKLIWAPNPNPSDPTWQYELKNIYDLGARGLSEDDRKTIQIRYNIPGSTPVTSIPDKNGNSKGIMHLMHVDETGETGTPDDLIDLGGGFNYGIDLEQGIIVFPRLRPFDPGTNPLNGFSQETYPDAFNNGTVNESVRFPNIYDLERNLQNERDFASNSRFEIVYRSSKRTARIQLGINILEGSEEVKVNGRTLTKDVDYIIDYFSGTIDLLSQEALLPSSDLEINYEQAQLFQVDKKAIFGARAEYSLAEWGLGQNSFIGTTALFQSQSTINKRVQIGEEPFRNFIWDINTNLEFNANYLTRVVNYIPFVFSSQPSKINIRGEYATLLPNPNTSNGLMRADENGVAYIDDFEAIKRTFPLGSSRRMWVLASKPVEKNISERGRTIWFQRQEPKKYISNIPTQAGDQVTVLGLAFQPKPIQGDYRKSWGGIMRGINIAASNELAESRFIELWVNPKTSGCLINIEIGMISEDQNGNGIFDKEIKTPTITNILESDTQDVGLDGLNDIQEDEILTRLGIPRNTTTLSSFQQSIIDSLQTLYPWGSINYSRSGPEDDPFGDNWDEKHARPTEYNRNPISANNYIEDAIRANDLSSVKVNGTEDNGGYKGQSIDGSVRYQDTEDIDGDRVPNFTNSYFRYTFSTDTTAPDTALIVGKGDYGWRLYRIPISLPDTLINSPSLNKINGVRLWVNPLENTGRIVSLLIADFQFVTSDWTFAQDYPNGLILPPNSKVPDPVEATRIVEISSINTEESKTYTRPPGVKNEYTTGQTGGADRRAIKEQSLALKLNQLPAGASAIIVKNIHPSDFRNYGKLKMFVHGDKMIYNGIILPNENDTTHQSPIHFFLRFGNNKNHYYEIEKPLFSGWAVRKNSIDLDFDLLTSLKFDATVLPDSENVRTYYLDGQIIRIKGNPSLASISQLYLGATNYDRFLPYTGEIWMDELRVTNVNDKPGHAAKAAFSFNMGDLLNFNSMIQYRTSEFRTIEQRFDANSGNTRSWNMAGSINLHKFFIEKWGINLPLSANLSRSESSPKFVPNNDILVRTAKDRNKANLISLRNNFTLFQDSLRYYQNNNDTASSRRMQLVLAKLDSQIVFEESFNDRMRSVTTTFGYGLSFSKNKSEDNFWLWRYTIDNLTSNYNFSFSESKNPQYIMNRNTSWSSNTSYNLPVKKQSLKIFSWMPLSGVPVIGHFFKNLKETDFNYALVTTASTDFQITGTQSQITERSIFGFPVHKPDVKTLTAGRGYGINLNPFQSMNSSLSVRYQSDLRGLTATEIIKGVAKGLNPLDGFDDFVYKSAIDTVKNSPLAGPDTLIYNRDYSVNHTFSFTYNPSVFNFATHNFSYNSTHSSNRLRSPSTIFNQSSQLSRRAQIDANLLLKNFIATLKEPFTGKTETTTRSESGGGRRARSRTSTESTSDQNTDTTKARSKESPFLLATTKLGSIGNSLLSMINDPRFSLSFDHSIAMSGLDKRPDPMYSWLGYSTTSKNGFIRNLFSFDLDTVREFNRSRLDSARGLFLYTPRKAITFNASYGFNFNYFTLDIRYEYSEMRTISNNLETRTITQNMLFPYLKSIPFPFYDMTIRAQNLGRHSFLKFLNILTTNFGIALTYNKKESQNINEFNQNTAYLDTFRSDGRLFQISSKTEQEVFPQINVDIMWIGGLSQSITFSNTTSRSFQPANIQNSNTKTFSSNINYTKRGGFRLPLPFLSKKQIQNEIRISTSFNLSKRKNYNINVTQNQKTKQKISDDTSWSIEPRADYSFTSRMTGGLFFKYENIKTLQTGKISRFAGGLTANISIGN